jgi:ABC-type dipeptide/oligopeptide/nickel transport system permease component
MDLCHGDLGKSLITKKPVSSQIVQALPYTLDLTIGGMLIGISLGVPIGILTALKRNRAPDYIGRILSLVGISMPEFYLGILLMYILAIKLDLFPVLGGGDLHNLSSRLHHLFLPALTLGIIMTAFYQPDGTLLDVECLGGGLCPNGKGQGASREGCDL